MVMSRKRGVHGRERGPLSVDRHSATQSECVPMRLRVPRIALLLLTTASLSTGCRKAPVVSGPPLIITSPEAQVVLELPGWEVHPKAIVGVPALGRQPALKPGDAAGRYEVATRWATTTVARHPSGAFLSFQKATDPKASCVDAFMSLHKAVRPPEPRTLNGISGESLLTTTQIEDFNGQLKSEQFVFSREGACYQVEVSSTVEHFDQVHQTISAAIDGLKPL